MPVGKLRRRIAISALAIIVIAGIWSGFGYNREPRHEGRPVSYWFREYCYSETEQPFHDDDEEKAEKAVTAMGTNAVRFLLAMALDTNEDTPVRKITKAFFDENFPHSRHRPRYVSQEDSRSKATELIGEIAPPAGLVLPSLRDTLSQTNTSGYSQAISVLTFIANPTNGSETLAPIFARALHGPDMNTMADACIGLNKLGTINPVAIPDLVSMLSAMPATNRLRDIYTELLGRYGTNAHTALPVLQVLFHGESNMRNRVVFAAAICKISLQDVEAFTYLTNSLTNRDDYTLRGLAETGLAYIGPRAASAIPALLDDLNTTNAVERSRLVEALNDIGASNDIVSNRVRESLQSTNDQIRETAAEFMLEKNKSDEDALGALMTLITEQSEYKRQAIIALGQDGLAAKGAIPIVLGVLDGTNSDCWPLVPSALTRMGAPDSLFLGKIEEKLKPEHHAEFSDPSEIEDLAGAALEFNPGNRDTQLILLRFHNKRALRMLGYANPAMAEIKARLHEAMNDNDVSIRGTASRALKQIEANEKGK